MKILVGPILGYESSYYTVCFLSDSDDAPKLTIEGNDVAFDKIGQTPQGIFWRAQKKISPQAASRTISYQISANSINLEDPFKRKSWSFYVPGLQESPKLAYATCNGFSSVKLARDTNDPYKLWTTLSHEHATAPFSLLLMGGDQVYADSLWESKQTPTLYNWSHKSREDQIKTKLTKTLSKELDAFYGQLYIYAWATDSNMALMLASIPSVMMWDDHDIFDGWGSYPDELLNCDVYQEIFKTARKYFELFQIRSLNNNTLLNKTGDHYALGLRFGDYAILAVDTRTDRTMTQIMSDKQWIDVKDWLDISKNSGVKQFLSLVSLPLAYRNFSTIDLALQGSPWHEELEDDTHDHWTVKSHQGERMKLIRHFLDFTHKHTCKSVVLSGDIHIGSLGLICDITLSVEMTQVVSSAIVHPMPTMFEWYGIQAVTSSDKQFLGKGDVTTEIIKPFGSDEYIITRNFATLKMGSDNKLWVNWICENGLKPEYPV
ncbi:MAG: alkaline phosphatase D family protein [Methylobacter tundripaludum]|nr:alkaline phosphatase D family protein [Methylobacter tundripaludum]